MVSSLTCVDAFQPTQMQSLNEVQEELGAAKDRAKAGQKETTRLSSLLEASRAESDVMRSKFTLSGESCDHEARLAAEAKLSAALQTVRSQTTLISDLKARVRYCFHDS